MNVPDWIVLVGALITLSVQTLALIMGMARFKNWLQSSVVEPYMKPLRDDIKAIKDDRSEDRRLLLEHDKYIYLLLGKQLGEIPPIGKEHVS
ncbi:MAG: hypothetical protein AB7G08_33400 [Hyphomicrobiaceae bacterium]